MGNDTAGHSRARLRLDAHVVRLLSAWLALASAHLLCVALQQVRVDFQRRLQCESTGVASHFSSRSLVQGMSSGDTWMCVAFVATVANHAFLSHFRRIPRFYVVSCIHAPCIRKNCRLLRTRAGFRERSARRGRSVQHGAEHAGAGWAAGLARHERLPQRHAPGSSPSITCIC